MSSAERVPLLRAGIMAKVRSHAIDLTGSDDETEPQAKRSCIRMVPLEDLHPVVALFRVGIPVIICQIIMAVLPTIQDRPTLR